MSEATVVSGLSLEHETLAHAVAANLIALKQDDIDFVLDIVAGESARKIAQNFRIAETNVRSRKLNLLRKVGMPERFPEEQAIKVLGRAYALFDELDGAKPSEVQKSQVPPPSPEPQPEPEQPEVPPPVEPPALDEDPVIDEEPALMIDPDSGNTEPETTPEPVLGAAYSKHVQRAVAKYPDLKPEYKEVLKLLATPALTDEECASRLGIPPNKWLADLVWMYYHLGLIEVPEELRMATALQVYAEVSKAPVTVEENSTQTSDRVSERFDRLIQTLRNALAEVEEIRRSLV